MLKQNTIKKIIFINNKFNFWYFFYSKVDMVYELKISAISNYLNIGNFPNKSVMWNLYWNSRRKWFIIITKFIIILNKTQHYHAYNFILSYTLHNEFTDFFYNILFMSTTFYNSSNGYKINKNCLNITICADIHILNI